MEAGLKCEIIYLDDELIEVRVSASNGRFSGVVDCYEGRGGLVRLADAVRGFPGSSQDQCEVKLGCLDSKSAGGGARFVLAKKDPTGHCVALVLLRSDEDDRSEVAEFNLPFLPGDLDAFVRELEAMREVVGAQAVLRAES
jgi:hypothetical protein